MDKTTLETLLTELKGNFDDTADGQSPLLELPNDFAPVIQSLVMTLCQWEMPEDLIRVFVDHFAFGVKTSVTVNKQFPVIHDCNNLVELVDRVIKSYNSIQEIVEVFKATQDGNH